MGEAFPEIYRGCEWRLKCGGWVNKTRSWKSGNLKFFSGFATNLDMNKSHALYETVFPFVR